ncbi:hypothetical protein PPTG_01000 [Phytophthora nicotianae INRA-310]|uniref:DUF1348 domain-containing protein n=1 Tax=Phytophthora nicotianae (strain INRA-310) TaxID=761204 RepID=W2RHX9_PHYN3|nr:hypothetical protein PPTG_01000 [Phytophthora nicotianae INRA-310]ETN24806.1 hypothetical protein PPTG_01000 [Phytophthora nicotianae INRA-310]
MLILRRAVSLFDCVAATKITIARGMSEAARPPVPPFTRETATLKVRAAEDAWNSRDPKRERESQYRLIKELFAFDGNRIAVRFAYEWLDAEKQQWYCAYGNENWVFDAQGYMAKRFACINDVPIDEKDRRFHWPQGRRPDDHPGLSELGL